MTVKCIVVDIAYTKLLKKRLYNILLNPILPRFTIKCFNNNLI